MGESVRNRERWSGAGQEVVSPGDGAALETVKMGARGSMGK